MPCLRSMGGWRGNLGTSSSSSSNWSSTNHTLHALTTTSPAGAAPHAQWKEGRYPPGAPAAADDACAAAQSCPQTVRPDPEPEPRPLPSPAQMECFKTLARPSAAVSTGPRAGFEGGWPLGHACPRGRPDSPCAERGPSKSACPQQIRYRRLTARRRNRQRMNNRGLRIC